MNNLADTFASGWLGAAGFSIAIFTLLTVVLAVAAALISRSGPIRLRHWAEEAGGRLLLLYDEPRQFQAFRFLLSLASRLAPILLAWWLYWLLTAFEVPSPGSLALAIVGVLLIAIEWWNRTVIQHRTEIFLRRFTWALRALYAPLWPLVWTLGHFFDEPEAGEEEEEDEASEDEIKAYIDVGLREGILEPEEEQLVRGIVDFGDTQVRSVMTPRVEMVSASVETGLEDLAELFFESKHARLPLYRESVDQIVGILHIRDLFEALHSGQREGDALKLSKAPHFVPETKVLRELFGELQRERLQMAIVVDEYGGVAGLVTVEDLVEEIVGDISDEHDEEEPQWEELEDGGFRLEGRAYLEDVDEYFGTAFDEVTYETVSGLICGELGYVPKVGEVFETPELSFTVEEADERRVLKMVLRKRQPAEVAADRAGERQNGGNNGE